MVTSKARLIVLALLGLVFSLFLSSTAYAAAEKGPRCSDGLDNDGDLLIDADDPDCGATDQTATRIVALVDAEEKQVGVPYSIGTSNHSLEVSIKPGAFHSKIWSLR